MDRVGAEGTLHNINVSLGQEGIRMCFVELIDRIVGLRWLFFTIREELVLSLYWGSDRHDA